MGSVADMLKTGGVLYECETRQNRKSYFVKLVAPTVIEEHTKFKIIVHNKEDAFDNDYLKLEEGT